MATKLIKKTKAKISKARAATSERSKLLVDTITQVAGEEAIPVVRFLKDKKNISEFKIADATKYEVSRIRSMLYKLHEHNLVTYYRKKDRKKGWYISYWTLNQDSVPHIAKVLRRQKIDMLTERLVKEQEHENLFYICRTMCTRMDFEQAAELQFKCPECGELVAQQDNSKTILNLRTRLTELQGS